MHDQRQPAESGDLLDRAGCIQLLAQCVSRRHSEPQYEFAVILLDCDNFKIVNESLGHRIGDQFLIELAARLQALLNGSGRLAHLGADEFAIVLDKVSNLRYALAVAERIRQDLRAPIVFGEQRLFVSVSQGITTSDIDYYDAIEVLRDADSALHYAKAHGRGEFAVFTNEMRIQAIRRLEVGTDLRLAISRGELCVYYQPIIGLEHGKITAFEALLRWQHPRLGLIPPGEFLAIAAEIGLLGQIDRWVLVTACRQVQHWRSAYLQAPQFSVNVNMSGRMLCEPDLVLFVQATLRECGLPANALSLEITEETVITQGDSALLTLNNLRALGVKISLDDFGTHYSSLSYLHQLPITTLKLDRSFLQEIESNQRSVHVISAVTGLAHALGIQVVGEGVENDAQLELLRSLHCDYGQGYFLARPQSAADIQKVIEYSPYSPLVVQAGAPTHESACAGVVEGDQPLVQRDALTGLLSRGMLANALAQAICRHQTLGLNFALIFLDLDFFKSVNDAFGHARGDRILIELAERVRAAVRSDDCVFRYGGDELVLLLQQCDRREAAVIAAAIVDRIAGQSFAGDPPLTLSGSMGVAIFPDDGLTAEALFEKADQRNYQAKRVGRGRAVWEDNAFAAPPSVEGPSRLIERDHALQICHRFLDAWPHETRGVLKINAAPQIGASRFLAEIEQAARLRGQVVLHLRGTPALKERAYGMFLELREVWPDLPLPSVRPAAFARALYEHLVQNRDDRLLIIVDHLATADHASVELLQEFVALPEISRLGIVYATHRSNHDLDLPRQHVLYAELQLEPLSLIGLRTWLRHSLNWEAPQEFLLWLHQQTQGRPAQIRDALAYLLQHEILRYSDGRWHYWSDVYTVPLSVKLEQLAARATQALPSNQGLFIGREVEIPRLKKLMRRHRLIQLIGPGGVGKSRLALQAAAELAHVFADGICYVQLSALDSSEFLTYAIADALGLSLTGTRSPAEQLWVHLASRQVLLLLDNVNNTAVDFSLLHEIEVRAPQVQILLTARDRLNLPAAETFPLESLSYPEDDGDWQIEQHSAVHLFVRLARMHLPEFALNEHERLHVARICRLVGGLPLGIELAAAWVRVLTCESIARQIEENLALLGPLPSGASTSAHLMSAMLDSLWNLMSEDERSLLRRMSVFRGGFSAVDARAVTGASLFFLEALVSKGYLRWNRRQRFEAHELLRQYAAARLRAIPGEQIQAQERHSRYYLQLLRQPALLQDGSQQTVDAISADHENIREAWYWAVRRQEIEVVFQHIDGLEMFYDLKGSFHEAEALFGDAIKRLTAEARRTTDSSALQRVIARLYTARARFLIRLSLYDEARRIAEKAHAINITVGDPLIEAHCLYHIGTVTWRQGEYQAAADYFDLARAMAYQGGMLSLETDCLRRLSRVACDMGRYDEARSYGEQSLAICRATGERQRESRMLNDLGIIADSQGDYAASRDYYEQCLQICRLIGDRPGEASALHNLGAGAADQGQYAESEVHLEQALHIFREIGLLQDEAIVIENLGDSARLQGDLDKAQTCYQQALHICREIGDRQGQAFLLANLGVLAHQSGLNEQADALCREALEIARTINDRRAEASALTYRGHTLVELGRLAEAEGHYRSAVVIYTELGQHRLAAEPTAGLARIHLLEGQADLAATEVEPLLPLLEVEALAGVTEPLRVFLTTYQVMASRADPRAEGLLRRAIDLLQSKAAAIVGDDRRRRFLANLPAHRDLLQAAAGNGIPLLQCI